MDISLPSRDALKAQAKRLRHRMGQSGHPISHAEALEAVAHQWGHRDWNTLSALAQDAPRPVWQTGQKVQGRYLGQRFSAVIKAASQRTQGFWRLTLRFDVPVDVIRSPLFENLRRQINCTVNAQGRSVHKTSDGAPHVVLFDHWSR